MFQAQLTNVWFESSDILEVKTQNTPRDIGALVDKDLKFKFRI